MAGYLHTLTHESMIVRIIAAKVPQIRVDAGLEPTSNSDQVHVQS